VSGSSISRSWWRWRTASTTASADEGCGKGRVFDRGCIVSKTVRKKRHSASSASRLLISDWSHGGAPVDCRHSAHSRSAEVS
jgi:hypothetical protein